MDSLVDDLPRRAPHRQESGIICDYSGVRRTLRSNRIRIKDVILFRVFDADDQHVGLAAVIANSERL